MTNDQWRRSKKSILKILTNTKDKLIYQYLNTKIREWTRKPSVILAQENHKRTKKITINYLYFYKFYFILQSHDLSNIKYTAPFYQNSIIILIKK